MTAQPNEEAIRAMLVEADKSKGLYELGEALRVLDGLDLAAKSRDVEHIERFWLSADIMNSSAGFVAILRDSRRLYLEVWINHDGADGNPPDGEVQVRLLASGEEPMTDDDVRALGGWHADVTTINDFLRQQCLPF